MKSFRLTEDEMSLLAEKYPTPFMVMSLDRVVENYRYLRKRLPMVNVFYAMKAKSTPAALLKLS